MRKFLSIIATIILCANVKAQGVAITEAADFTFSANGKDMTLFEVLDSGKHALLYFFNYKSPTSEVNAPIMNGVYNELGKNRQDVYLIGLDPSNESVLLENWGMLTEIEYPLVAKDQAYMISQTYSGSQYGVMLPTLILISPEHDILLDEIWPITSTEQIVEIVNENLIEFEKPEVTLGVPQNLTATATGTTTVDLTWDVVEDAMAYHVYNDSEFLAEVTNTKYTVEELTAGTEYCFYVLAINNLEESEKAEACVKTNEVEQEEHTIPDAPQITVWVENPYTVVIEWEAVEGAYFYTVYERDNLIGTITGTEVGIDVWDGQTYCFTVTASNDLGESEHSNEECATTPSISEPDDDEPVDPEGPDAIEELTSSFNIYPNPASSEVKITSEMSGQAEIRIFDMTGRCVKNISVSDISNATINVNDINEGVYVININGKVEKLTIK